jgi:hypothetical protein
MRHTHSQTLSDAQVAQLQERRKRLGLSPGALLHKFEAALQREGCVHSLASAKMRLDRVLNPYLRRPVTEATLAALAAGLSWTLIELETALGLQCSTEAASHRAGDTPAMLPPERRFFTKKGGDFNLTELLRELEKEMRQASGKLEFERAALLRDQIMEVKKAAPA